LPKSKKVCLKKKIRLLIIKHMVLYSLKLWEPLYCDTTTKERIEKFVK